MSSDASVCEPAAPPGLGRPCTRAERLRDRCRHRLRPRADGRRASRSTDRPIFTSSLPSSHRCPLIDCSAAQVGGVTRPALVTASPPGVA
eukprot:3647364-Prymnesium_polylepis.2